MQNHKHLEPARLAETPWLVTARFVDTVKENYGGSVDASDCERYPVIEQLCVEVWWDLKWLCERRLVGGRDETDRLRTGQFEKSGGGKSEAQRGACFAELVGLEHVDVFREQRRLEAWLIDDLTSHLVS